MPLSHIWPLLNPDYPLGTLALSARWSHPSASVCPSLNHSLKFKQGGSKANKRDPRWEESASHGGSDWLQCRGLGAD